MQSAGESEMKQLKRILVGTDFSEGAAAALRRAARLSVEHDAVLIVSHVVAELPHAARFIELPLTREQMQDALAERVNEALRESGVDPDARNVEIHVHFGKPVLKLIECAREVEADLIVVGQWGRDALERIFTGSVASSLVRHADRDVLIVRDPAGRAMAYRRVLAAVDLDEFSIEVIRSAGQWAAADEALLQVLYAWEPGGLADYTSVAPNLPSRPFDQQVVARAQERIGELADRALEPGHNAGLFVRPGTAATEILEFAEDDHIDLIVVGSHARRGVERLLLGNTADRVISRAAASVLVVRAQDEA